MDFHGIIGQQYLRMMSKRQKRDRKGGRLFFLLSIEVLFIVFHSFLSSLVFGVVGFIVFELIVVGS